MHWLFIFLLSTLITGLMVKFSWRLGLVDKPGERRTHQVPTPRGGGLAIVLTCMLSIYQIIFLPALVIGLMGFWDDLKNLSAKIRFFLQFLCACSALYAINHFHGLALWGISIPALLVVLWMMWLTNLYNFMDGINGIAGMEAIFVSLAMVLLHTAYQDAWLVIACASFGFLLWNFPRAKIFMGDVGSQFIGFMMATLCVMEWLHASIPFVTALILLGIFIVDASVTLATRMLTGQKFSTPHRSHTYQILWKKFGGNHVKVTSLLFLVNLLWLFPWAFAVSHLWVNDFLGLLISYAPLVIIALLFKAGRLIS